MRAGRDQRTVRALHETARRRTMDTNFTIRLDGPLKKTLDKLAKATGRSRAFLAQDALRQYVEEQAWQVAEIKKAIKEADASDFATEAEVNAVRAKWSANAG